MNNIHNIYDSLDRWQKNLGLPLGNQLSKRSEWDHQGPLRRAGKRERILQPGIHFEYIASLAIGQALS